MYVKLVMGYEFGPGALLMVMPCQLSCALGKLGAAPAADADNVSNDGSTNAVPSPFSMYANVISFWNAYASSTYPIE